MKQVTVFFSNGEKFDFSCRDVVHTTDSVYLHDAEPTGTSKPMPIIKKLRIPVKDVMMVQED